MTVDTPLTDAELATLQHLLDRLAGPGATLTPPLFRFMTAVMATTNVDLLVEDNEHGVLLAWRDDAFGTGWHVPGSIVRHREGIAERIAACAMDELGCAVEAAPGPAALIEILDGRGHSMSLVFRARLRGEPGRRLLGDWETPDPGDLCWFRTLPARMYPSHAIYRDVLAAPRGDGIPLFSAHVGADGDAIPAPVPAPDGEIGPATALGDPA